MRWWSAEDAVDRRPIHHCVPRRDGPVRDDSAAGLVSHPQPRRGVRARLLRAHATIASTRTAALASRTTRTSTVSAATAASTSAAVSAVTALAAAVDSPATTAADLPSPTPQRLDELSVPARNPIDGDELHISFIKRKNVKRGPIKTKYSRPRNHIF